MRAWVSARRGLAHSYGDSIKGTRMAAFVLAILLDLGATSHSAAKSRRRRLRP